MTGWQIALTILSITWIVPLAVILLASRGPRRRTGR
jgi:hypothetical protein